MKTLVSIALLSAVVFAANSDHVLPSYLSKCDRFDNFEECVKKQIEIGLKNFTMGVPELGVPSLDPIHLADILADGNGLKLEFTDPLMHGLSTAKVTKLKIDLVAENFELGFVANMSLTAKYEVDGKILILPIKGNGDADIQCLNVDVDIRSTMKHHNNSAGEDHFKLITPSYSYNIEKTTFKLHNLFNGNKQLAETTHQFANNNWRQLMDDLAPPAIKQIVKTGVKAMNKFFNKVPIKNMINNYYQ